MVLAETQHYKIALRRRDAAVFSQQRHLTVYPNEKDEKYLFINN